MTAVSDPDSLLRYLRNVFVTCDDSGVCENLLKAVESSDDETEGESRPRYRTRSPDFKYQAEDGPSFWETRVKQRQKQQPVNIKHNCPSQSPASNRDTRTDAESPFADLFPKQCPRGQPKSAVSGLTRAMEGLAASKRNQFTDFAIFDGRPAEGPAKGIQPLQVWLWKIVGLPKVFLLVQPTQNCRVADLSGLVLWQYFNETPGSVEQFNLQFSNPENAASIVDRIAVFALDLADEEVEMEFPPLCREDSIHKYEFEAFALVEQLQDKRLPASDDPLVLTHVHLAQGISIFNLPVSTTLRSVQELAIRRRKLRQHEGYEYRLEGWIYTTESVPISDPNHVSRRPLDLNLRLSDCLTAGLPLRFVLIREHSRYKPVIQEPNEDHKDIRETHSLPRPNQLQFRKYRVSHRRGIFMRQLEMSISPDCLELKILRPKIFGSTKPIFIPMERLLHCSMNPQLPNNTPISKVRFTITYLPMDGDFSVTDIISMSLETQWSSARAIIRQINLIFTTTTSSFRLRYAELLRGA